MKLGGWFLSIGIFLLAHLCPAAPAPPPWSSGGPFGGRITALSFEPSTRTIYAGTFNAGIYRSTDGARSWSPLPNNPSYAVVSTVAADPSNPDTLLFTGVREGLSRTADGGRGWEKPTGIPGYLWHLAFDPRVRGRVWAAGDEGVFSSADSGRTWRTALSPVKVGRAFAVVPDPIHRDTVWVGGKNGLFRSRDGGVTWTSVTAVPVEVRSIALDTKDPSFVVALGQDSLFTSENAGEAWSRAPMAKAGAIGYRSLLVSSGSPRRILAILHDDLIASGDKGRTWETVGSSRGASSFDVDLLADPAEAKTFYASSRTGVLKSTDGGKTWRSANQGLTGIWVNAVAVDFRADRRLYAATRWGRFCSLDAGTSWIRIEESVHDVRGLAIDPESEGSFYSATPVDDQSLVGPLLLKSRFSSGVLRETAGEAPDQGYSCVIVDPNSPRTVWAGSVRGVRRSTDAGATWPSAGLENEEITSLALGAPGSRVVYAASRRGGVFKTTDGGENWSNLAPSLMMKDLSAVVVPADKPDLVWVASHGSGLFRSQDGGASWSQVFSFPYPWIRTLLITSNGRRVFAGTNGKGVFESDDGGETWVSSNDGLTGLSVLGLARDPITGLLVAATSKGVFVRQGPADLTVLERPVPVGTAPVTPGSSSAEFKRRVEKDIAVLKWRRTMGDMRSLATALEAYAVNHSLYPPTGDLDKLAALLTPTYMRTMPRLDAWDHPLRVEISATRNDFRITSAGADGVFENRSPLAATKPGSPGATPKSGPGIGPSDDPGTDAVFENGTFIRWWSELPTPP